MALLPCNWMNVPSFVPIRKATLALIRKMVHYAPSQLLGDIYNSDVTGFTPVLVEVLAAVLDHEVSS